MPDIDLSARAPPALLPELMDAPCSFDVLEGCLRGIAQINRWTFAYRPTLIWLDELVSQLPPQRAPLKIVDVGCGYGDSLRRIARWAARRCISVSLTGIDLNADAVRAAQAATSGTSIRFLHGDAYSLDREEVDVVLSSLLTHHLEDEEIVRFLRWMEATARRGWFVNDLHRTMLPYRAFSLLGKVLPLHPFVRNDGLVSIRRSFLHDDWQRLITRAGLPTSEVSVQAYRPARLCVGRVKL